MTIAIIIIGGAAILIIALICAVAFISGIEKGYNMSDKKDEKYVEYEEDDECLEKNSHSLADKRFAPDIDSFHIGDIGKLTYL